MSGVTWAPAIVNIDGRHPVPGEVMLGRSWNGWAIPRFTREVTERLTARIGEEDQGNPDGTVFTWREDGALIVRNLSYVDDPGYEDDVLTPDADGMYALGAFNWVWSIDEDASAFYEQNDLLRRDVTPDQIERIAPLAEHHAGGLFVALGETAEVCVKIHDSWGDDGMVVVHTYNPDHDPDDRTMQSEVHFTNGREAVDYFFHKIGA